MFKNDNSRRYNYNKEKQGGGPVKNAGFNTIYENNNNNKNGELNESKFKTQYGFNMNKPMNNLPNYHFRRNYNKENRSISPNSKKLADIANSMGTIRDDKESANNTSVLSTHKFNYRI